MHPGRAFVAAGQPSNARFATWIADIAFGHPA
jgi:hypothetical protein